jgi:hypothetical protein
VGYRLSSYGAALQVGDESFTAAEGAAPLNNMVEYVDNMQYFLPLAYLSFL